MKSRYMKLIEYAGIQRMSVDDKIFVNTCGSRGTLKEWCPVSKIVKRDVLPGSARAFTFVILQGVHKLESLTHAHKLLKKQGVMVAVLPARFMFSDNVDFINWFQHLNGEYEEISDGRNVMIRIRSEEYEHRPISGRYDLKDKFTEPKE